MPKEIETELDREFEEAPEEIEEEEIEEETAEQEEEMEKTIKEEGSSVPIELNVTFSRNLFSDIRENDVVNAVLRAKKIENDTITFEIVRIDKPRKKSIKEIERDSQGSYKVRD